MNARVHGTGRIALAAENLGQRYDGRWVLRDVSFSLPRGALCALLGPNGSGKSTLLRALAGVARPASGRVIHHGRIGYVPQEVHPALPLSARDMVLLGRAGGIGLLRAPGRHDYAAVDAALARVEASDLAVRAFSSLSGGERQLVLMARALASDAEVLLLDEPTAAMDWHNQALILRLLAQLAEAGITIVLSTHAPQHAQEFASHALLVFGADAHAFGPPGEVMSDQALSRLYRLPVCSVALPGGNGAAAIPVFSRADSRVDNSAASVFSTHSSATF